MSELPDDKMNIPISPERLLAAVLKNVGAIEISVDDIVGDYSNFQIYVEQNREGYITFELAEAEDEES